MAVYFDHLASLSPANGSDITVGVNGYLGVFTMNIDFTSEVWIDNLKVTYSRGRLLEEQHYYPHGLVAKDGNNNPEPNRYLYQGKELQDEAGLQLYDFHARQYDPQLGRFWGVDPLDQFPSGYTGMGNDPGNQVDPTGMLSVKDYNNPQVEHDAGAVTGDMPEYINVGRMSEDIPQYADPYDETGQKDGRINSDNDGALTNIGNGFLDGMQSTLNAIKDLATVDGAKRFLLGSAVPASEINDAISKIPSLKASDYQYGAGFALEKVVEILILQKVTKGIDSKLNTNMSRGNNVAEDMVRVRHHTSAEGLNGIRNSGSINPSRGSPYGVDVEVQPFINARKVSVGQNGRGSYVEFTIPKQQLPIPPSYMGGRGNVGRIVTGSQPLNLNGLRPKYVRFNWLGY